MKFNLNVLHNQNIVSSIHCFKIIIIFIDNLSLKFSSETLLQNYYTLENGETNLYKKMGFFFQRLRIKVDKFCTYLKSIVLGELNLTTA